MTWWNRLGAWLCARSPPQWAVVLHETQVALGLESARLGRQVEQLLALVQATKRGMEGLIMATRQEILDALAALNADVAAETDALKAMEQTLDGNTAILDKLIADAGGSPISVADLTALSDAMKANKQTALDAIARDTRLDPNAPPA